MIDLISLENREKEIEKYLEQSDQNFCDITLGEKFMWQDYYKTAFCIYNQTLIMREIAEDGTECFYYPIGEDCDGALLKIEEYCLEKKIPLVFTCVDDARADLLEKRYAYSKVEFDRDWNDYIYLAQNFVTYSGKKLSGQRNHVNKFKKEYPEHSFSVATKEDVPKILEFLKEYYGEHAKNDAYAQKDQELCVKLIERFEDLNQLAGILRVQDKIVGVSVGEILGDTLIVHVEKALSEYKGVYPTLASSFVKTFKTDSVIWVNREEDCGDEGLRTSKMQYHPAEIKRKNNVYVNTVIDEIFTPFNLTTDRLTITDVKKDDEEVYAKLYLDEKLNEFWGYDYHEDLNGESPTPNWFFNFQKKLKETGEEYSLAVRENEKMIGELVLHTPDYFGGVEIGFRFFSEYHGKGYATESAQAVIDYMREKHSIKKIRSRCFKNNLASRKLIERLGLTYKREDKEKYYFEKIF